MMEDSLTDNMDVDFKEVYDNLSITEKEDKE